jgi:signal transduction histidine kinase
LGAPLGLIALRRFGRGWRDGLRRQLIREALTYAYVTGSTCFVFASFGWMLGRRADQLVASYRVIDRLREEFTSVIAHDLRSPVNALRLQSRLLLEQAGDEVRAPRGAIERIDRATSNLAQMIDDLLDASRIEAQRLALDAAPHSLAELAAEVIERQRPALGSHAVELVAHESPRVLVDPHRFAQILTNLLENAAKYSDENRPIRVVVEPGEGGVAVAVEDQGWGIEADDVPRLFDRFYQATRARAKKAGLGLGLYIVEGLMEAHGGRISVASTPGRGSRFVIWFPAV